SVPPEPSALGSRRTSTKRTWTGWSPRWRGLPISPALTKVRGESNLRGSRVREPNAVFVQADPSDGLTTAVRTGPGWSASGVEVGWSDGVVEVTAATISRVALRWSEPVPPNASILGDAWERSYGDLQWRHHQPERFLPWYFLAHDRDTGTTTGAGV